MRLVSAEEAKVILGFMEMGGLDGSTPSREKYRLAATVEALYEERAKLQALVDTLSKQIDPLWPIVEKAAKEPCTVQNGPCEVWLDDREQWCSRCLARWLKAQVKEAQGE